MARLLGTIPAARPYEAYAGPETGGFGVVPPSAVPDPAIAGDVQRWLLESSGMPGTSVPVVPREALKPGPRLLATIPAPMAAATIAPKGGTPHRASKIENEANELYRRVTSEGDAPPAYMPGGPWENAGVSLVKQHANNLLAAPGVAGDITSYPSRAVYNLATQGPSGFQWPALSAFPKPTTTDIAAKLRAATSDISEAEARANIEAADRAREEQYPISSALGGIGGDVTTIATGRAPFTQALRKGEVAIGRKIAHGKTHYEAWPFLNRAERVKITSQAPQFNMFKRGLKRTAEAGVEGASLELLKQRDPVEMALFSAGIQGVASGATDVLTRKFVKLPSRVATFAVNAFILSNLFYAADVALPGQAKDYEAQKSATQKMLWGYGLGTLTAAVSARARSGAISAEMPHLMDALGSAPRNAMQSVLGDYLAGDDAKRQDVKGKVTTLWKSIEQLNETQLAGLAAAFDSGNKDRFYKELDKVVKGLPQ